LRSVLDRQDVLAASIYGSWASGARRPDSDVDVIVIGDAALGELRRLIRPLERATGRRIDLTLMSPKEFREAHHSSFTQKLEESPTIPVVGDLTELSPP
jgi:predicted nucleotidyltransferase